ncbi:uncharacterized protein LOC143568470 isoform X2 [Bidens hawaiensis]|uniref:uncharacterized protein LOC143568470 isoform X2 n=1 Tax=Bidens hawaiensis TaxID=980011 RepID=UPI004049BB86
MYGVWILRGARRIFSTTAGGDSPRLIRFALHPPNHVEVEFANGSLYKLPAEYLRVFSPAVDSKIRSISGQKVIYGRRYVVIMSAEPVGNYGVAF